MVTSRQIATQDLTTAIGDATQKALANIIGADIGGNVGLATGSAVRGFVSVKDFGAVGDGVTDDTVAIQAALNSGAKAVFVPPGTYNFTALTMPTTLGITLYGTNGSVLVQKGAGIAWPVSGAGPYTVQGYVRDLSFDGTAGTGHTLSTANTGGMTLMNLYFNNTPVGFSSLFMDGTATTYTHDTRAINIQLYSSTAGHSGIRCGPKFSDGQISSFIMNGNLVVSYGIYFDVGAQSTKVSDSHPYNTSSQVVYFAGSNNWMQFTNCTIDNSSIGLLYATNIGQFTFHNCWFESCPSGQSCVTLNNSASAKLVGCVFSGVAGVVSGVVETGTSNNTSVIGGILGSTFSAPFNLIGSASVATLVNGYNPLGANFGFSGVGQAGQGQATTQYYGINGMQSTAGFTSYLVPYPGTIQSVVVNVTNTPAAGQTFTFTVYKNGSSIGSAGIINNGSFGVTISLGVSVVATDQIYIGSVFSATSGSSTVRYYANFTG